MRILVVEDDFVSRCVFSEYLRPYGVCDVAANGLEGLKAFQLAFDSGKPYELICLDIMMPEMDGQTVLKEIRKYEEEKGIKGLEGVKIIMTTALDDFQSIMTAFKGQCEGYLVKPIEKGKLVQQLRNLGLIDEGNSGVPAPQNNS
ncbi:MAG: response regulator [Candidatus Riflebacteria bacterium]|nr:response regulator [Candidatus Riflebacteria bacterium]